MASLIHDIIKYTVMILCLINVVLIAWTLIQTLTSKSVNTENVIYMVLMLIIFIVGAYAAHTEDFLYLIIFGVVIVVGLSVGFLIRFGAMEKTAMIILAVLVFVFALIIKRGGI